jgi:carotenoid cleavage dioxygenase-like enzyme
MLDGDGYSLRFEFTEGGDALFRSKFVRTDEFKAEEAADAVVGSLDTTFHHVIFCSQRRHACHLLTMLSLCFYE